MPRTSICTLALLLLRRRSRFGFGPIWRLGTGRSRCAACAHRARTSVCGSPRARIRVRERDACVRVTRGCAVSACLAHALPRCNLFRSLAPVRALPTSVVCDSRSRVSSLCCHALWTLLGCMPCCLLTHLRLLQLCMGSIWPRRLVPVAVACACPASLARSPSRRSRAVCAGTLPPSSCLSRLSLAAETFDLRSSTLSQARCRLGRRQPTRGKRRARQHVAGCAPP